MARKTAAPAEPSTTRVRYPADGPVEALRNTSWDVPSTVTNKRSWIESQHREAVAREAAAAEQASREKAVLSDRIEQQRSTGSNALQMAEQRITALEQLVQEPDLAKILNATTAFLSAVERTTALTNQLMDQEARAVEATERHGAVVAESEEYLAGVEEGRQQVLALVSNQQQMVNGSFSTYAEALQRFQGYLNEQEQRIGDLATRVSDSWEVVSQALSITESAKEIARQEANELITRQLTEFRLFLSVALNAIGVTERDITEALNRMDQGVQREMFVLPQSFIVQAVAIAQKFQDARDDAEYRTNKASAESAGLLRIPKGKEFA